MFFLSYVYPGNVRELQHIIERFCLLGGKAEALFNSLVQLKAAGEKTGLDIDSFLADPDPLQAIRARVEKELILRALEQNNQ